MRPYDPPADCGSTRIIGLTSLSLRLPNCLPVAILATMAYHQRMRVISVKALREFWQGHPDCGRGFTELGTTY
jgi:hypothetical protein